MTAAHQIDASIGSGAWRGLDPRADRVYQSVLSAEARRLVREMRIGAPTRHATLASDVCQDLARESSLRSVEARRAPAASGFASVIEPGQHVAPAS